MNEEEREEREKLRKEVLFAKTLNEVVEARRKLRAWLRRHPDDKQLLGEGESLAMLESALRQLD